MSTPLPILVARLEHELETARLHADVGSPVHTVIVKAIGLAKTLREAL